jgi:hypothetical protein
MAPSGGGGGGGRGGGGDGGRRGRWAEPVHEVYKTRKTWPSILIDPSISGYGLIELQGCKLELYSIIVYNDILLYSIVYLPEMVEISNTKIY